MENTNKPQKKSLFGFIWPYIVIIGFIAMFLGSKININLFYL